MSKKEHTAILRVGTQLVSQLVETLLHESEGAQPDPARLGSVLHALSIFCAARPTMLLPHIELLPTYLQYQHQEAAPAVRHVCEMLPRLLPYMKMLQWEGWNCAEVMTWGGNCEGQGVSVGRDHAQEAR